MKKKKEDKIAYKKPVLVKQGSLADVMGVLAKTIDNNN